MGNLRILLVDDHRDTLLATARLLQFKEYEVRTAGTAREALSLSNSDPCDLLITDLGLPDGSGAALLREIRQQYAVKAIALTGWSAEGCPQADRDLFHSFLIKPVSFDQLLGAIRHAQSAEQD